jgi:hypothetical protein
MSYASFVSVFEPADATQIMQAKIALAGANIPFIVQNGEYMNVMGFPNAIGITRVGVLVPEDCAEDAREVLDDWFAGTHPVPAEPDTEERQLTVLGYVAAPFLLMLGVFSPEMAIALGRRLSRSRSEARRTRE